MLFGQNFQPFGILFTNLNLGTPIQVGVDTSFWIGQFAAIRNGVLVLTDAQLHANMGKPIGGIRQNVRIPISAIRFVCPVEGPEVSREARKAGEGEQGRGRR